MALSSAECQAKIEEFERIKGEVSGVTPGLQDCQDEVANCNKYFETLIINGESIDKGDLSTINSSLTSVASILNQIISECDDKISEYTQLKHEALERERIAAERERARNNAWKNSSDSDGKISETKL